jgi:(2R)-sulfolactate sulfo-lyase subunit alpha
VRKKERGAAFTERLGASISHAKRRIGIRKSRPGETLILGVQVSSAIPHFLVHSPKDNVGVIVVEGLKAGTKMTGVITENDTTTSVTAKEDIPIGHKVALRDLKTGDTVIKYGEDIGRMIGDVKQGEHVHVQNLKTKRW